MADKIVLDRAILSQVSKETSWKEVRDLQLAERLVEANKTAWTKGAGLAAIQIGVPLRFAWHIDRNGESHYLLNPVILKYYGSIESEEGCLSLPGQWFKMKRAISIDYITDGKKKKASGFQARLIQHEIDHMNGILVSEKGIPV